MNLRGYLRPVRSLVLMLAAGASAIVFADNQTATQTGKKNEMKIVLDEWRISSNKVVVKAGPVKFRVNNLGKEDHELVIVKTDLAIDKLPLRGGKVDEDAAGELIGEIEEFSPNTVQEATFNLSAGRYVLICNIVEEEHGKVESHFSEGMRIALNVE
ncbi:MAG TPA: cupredoxin domain-containing protein [Gammaproteobacteria bacterium]